MLQKGRKYLIKGEEHTLVEEGENCFVFEDSSQGLKAFRKGSKELTEVKEKDLEFLKLDWEVKVYFQSVSVFCGDHCVVRFNESGLIRGDNVPPHLDLPLDSRNLVRISK